MTRLAPDSALAGFDPASDPRGFRTALGRFATGVTVVTIDGPEGPAGMTANSFTSVSLDPPLVLWSLDRASSRYAAFAGAESFAIHVIGRDARALCGRFTRGGEGFAGLAAGRNGDGVPTLPGALARFDCRRDTTVPAGDHLLILGAVSRVEMAEGAPLVFQGGAFGEFVPM